MLRAHFRALAPILSALVGLAACGPTLSQPPAVLQVQQHLEPCPVGRVAEAAVETFGEDAVPRLAKALQAGRDADLTAAQIRKLPGVSGASAPLFDAKRMMRGTNQNAGLVPKEIADKLTGKEFRDFDHFREEFWKATADSKYASEWTPAQLATMRGGGSPFAQQVQHIGERGRYELHHIQPIQHGGSVYDMSNLMVTTPRFHQDVLSRAYHYGSG